jgi:hypothetical protein
MTGPNRLSKVERPSTVQWCAIRRFLIRLHLSSGTSQARCYAHVQGRMALPPLLPTARHGCGKAVILWVILLHSSYRSLTHCATAASDCLLQQTNHAAEHSGKVVILTVDVHIRQQREVERRMRISHRAFPFN